MGTVKFFVALFVLSLIGLAKSRTYNYPVVQSEVTGYSYGGSYGTNGYPYHYNQLNQPYQGSHMYPENYVQPAAPSAPYPYQQYHEQYYEELGARKHDRSLLENLNGFPTVKKTDAEHVLIGMRNNCPNGQIDKTGRCRTIIY